MLNQPLICCKKELKIWLYNIEGLFRIDNVHFMINKEIKTIITFKREIMSVIIVFR